MSTLRRTATIATDTACRILGRRQVVRAARFILRRACLDVPNDIETNGEAWLQHRVIAASPHGCRICVIDVGANVGRWSLAMLAAARSCGRLGDVDLYAFEPSAYTFACLSEALAGTPATLGHAALGERSGSSVLHVRAPGAGTNSLHGLQGSTSHDSMEEVQTTTLDAYANQAGLDRIDLLKIDTEGHDLAVIGGARGLLAEQRVSIIQFEYNHRWVYARNFLRDAFEVLEPFGYQVGKLTPLGVEFYPRWDPDLETFVEGNYVACTARAAESIPAVQWWKSANK